MAMWFISLWNWFGGGVWKGLEVQASEALECRKQSLVGNSVQNSEDRVPVKARLMFQR